MEHHARLPIGDFKTELRSDAAGYYIYLPGFLHHRMRIGWINPDHLHTIGLENLEDTTRNLIITKYTYGTALLELPFYLMADLVEGFGATDGFTPTHHRAIDLAGIFYWWAGLIMLWSALQRRWRLPWGVAVPALFILSQGTNVFYYAFRSPGYSHIYSWFLACVALWSWTHGLVDHGGRRRAWLFRLACAWLILIRPLDVLLVLALYAFVLSTEGPGILRGRWIVGQLLVGTILAAPQLIYWKAAFGSWIYFSYQGEGFTNWESPFLMQTLLAPKNGWIPYAPSFVLLPMALWALWKREKTTVIISSVLFLLYWYAVSSWSEPSFGCSFGQRSLVQTVPILALVVWATIHSWWPSLRWIILAIVPAFMVLALMNHMHAQLYDVCYWASEWDWGQYLADIGKVLK